MDVATLPADYFVTSHAFTKTTYRDTYPSIDPFSPKLSQKGKTVIITGASQGIGKAIALAFAQAGASKLVLAARTAEKLEAVKEEVLKINASAEVLVVPTDTTSASSVQYLEDLVKEKFGTPDVLVNGVGIWSSTEAIAESKPEEWWGDFEVNVKGTYLVTRAFLRLVGRDREASIVNVGTWGMLMTNPTGTSYSISKLAMARLSEAVPVGYPKVCSTIFHPGMVKTDMAGNHPEVLNFCEDTAELAAGTAVYLASPQAHFLSGRYMSANWDVDELEARQTEIVEKDLLKMDLKGDFGTASANTPSTPDIKTTAPQTIDSITLYPHQPGAHFDIAYFANVHLPLALHHWGKYGMRSYALTDFAPTNTEPKPIYNAQLTVTWDSVESMHNALTAPDREPVFADVPNFTSVSGFTLTGAVVGSAKA